MINKKGQQVIGLSFETIFSIILIVFFITIAIIVINSFLNTKKCAEIGIFIDRFKSDVKKTWNSQSDSHTFKANLPSSIDYVCFANLSRTSNGNFKQIGNELSLFEGKNANTFFYPSTKACEMPFNLVAHLDIEKITKTRNPNCVPVIDSKIEIVVEKGFDDKLVSVKI